MSTLFPDRFNGVPQFQQNTGTLLSGLGFLGTGVLAASNVASGNDKLSLKPSLGGYFDAQGNFIPTLQAGVQLGEGAGSTSLNVGGGLKNGELTPVVSTGVNVVQACLLYTSPSPRDRQKSRMPSSA